MRTNSKIYGRILERLGNENPKEVKHILLRPPIELICKKTNEMECPFVVIDSIEYKAFLDKGYEHYNKKK